MLTTAQLLTMRSWVQASVDPAIVDARTRGATYDLMLLLNAKATPTTKAWSAEVTAQTLDEGADYAAFDSVAAGKRDAWRLFLDYAPRDMSKQKLRKVVTDIWGSATAGSTSESILNGCTENATVAQVAIGGSSASTGTVSALKRTFDGIVTQEDCQAILEP